MSNFSIHIANKFLKLILTDPFKRKKKRLNIINVNYYYYHDAIIENNKKKKKKMERANIINIILYLINSVETQEDDT